MVFHPVVDVLNSHGPGRFTPPAHLGKAESHNHYLPLDCNSVLLRSGGLQDSGPFGIDTSVLSRLFL